MAAGRWQVAGNPKASRRQADRGTVRHRRARTADGTRRQRPSLGTHDTGRFARTQRRTASATQRPRGDATP